MPSARPIRYINAVMASVIDGIVTADETGVIVSFNPAAERIFGYSADKILGKHVLTLLSEPFRSEQARDLRDYLRGGESTIIGVNREVIGLRKDGTAFPMDLAVSEVRLDGARVFVGAVRDITKRKRAEEALQRSEERFELAVRGSRDGLWDWDIVSDEVYYAPQYMALLGFSENEYPGFADSFRSHLHPKDRERVFAAFMAHLKERRPFDEEFRHQCNDGSIRYFRARGPVDRRVPGGGRHEPARGRRPHGLDGAAPRAAAGRRAARGGAGSRTAPATPEPADGSPAPRPEDLRLRARGRAGGRVPLSDGPRR